MLDTSLWWKLIMDFERRRNHIFDTFGKAFIPQSRMRHIQWEESVLRSQARRDGKPNPVVRHDHCSCGNIECLGSPFNYTKRMEDKAESEKPRPQIRFVHRDSTIQYW
jgi:hypothetical protein